MKTLFRDTHGNITILENMCGIFVDQVDPTKAEVSAVTPYGERIVLFDIVDADGDKPVTAYLLGQFIVETIAEFMCRDDDLGHTRGLAQATVWEQAKIKAQEWEAMPDFLKEAGNDEHD